MRKVFSLPLLAALPALLSACGDDDIDLYKYKRNTYNSYASCMQAYRAQVRPGLENPCQKASYGSYFGPYYYISGGRTRYVGYTASGLVAASGISYDSKKGSYGSFKAPSVNRGGFTSTSRASSGSSSSSYGG